MENKIKTPGEAIGVLIQVAELAQSRGVLSFDDSIITKAAIDFLSQLAKEEGPVSEAEEQ